MAGDGAADYVDHAHVAASGLPFGRYLKESMQEETIAYVTQMLKDNRPARELIDSHWTMMNDASARHYGYEGFAHSDLRRPSSAVMIRVVAVCWARRASSPCSRGWATTG